ncbi:hypothetical protein OF83DRAFT_1141495 [Amylostereum chailletii]|nr:hypothetical protein OF83DRAFT_1141495 [Amylostereum chailletii]
MPRGRKKDLTTPPSRALAHQRNYRARRAQYVADLETRCRTAEAEVVRLRAELAHATGEASESDDGRKEEERARAELVSLWSDWDIHTLGAGSKC